MLHTSVQTGRDGCICKFFIDSKAGRVSSEQNLVCTGVEDVTAISIVESVEYCQVMDRKKDGRRVAIGFIASNFVLWDLTNQSEVNFLVPLSSGFSLLVDHAIPDLSPSHTKLVRQGNQWRFNILRMHMRSRSYFDKGTYIRLSWLFCAHIRAEIL